MPKAMPEICVNLKQHIVTFEGSLFPAVFSALKETDQIFQSVLLGHSHSSTLSRWPKLLEMCPKLDTVFITAGDLQSWAGLVPILQTMLYFMHSYLFAFSATPCHL